MNDYAVRGPQNDAEPPGPFVVGRGVRFNYQVLEKTDGAAEVGLGMSGARWTAEVRVYRTRTSTTLLRRETLTKSATGAGDGFLDHYFGCGTTPYTRALYWEVVLVDNDNTDSSTRTTKREYLLLEFRDAILPAPRTGP